MLAMAYLRSRRAAFLIASTTGLATAASFGFIGGVPEASAQECGNGAVVIVAGTNDPTARDLEQVKQRYEQQGYIAVNTEYPTTLWPLGATGYDSSTRQGHDSAIREIASYQQDCQDKPVVVVGYSQGARIAGDVLAEIGNANGKKFDVNGTPDNPDDDLEIDPDLISGELYSDPRRAGDKTGRGIELSLIGIIPGLTMTGPRGNAEDPTGFGVVSDRVVSVCVDGDPICDLPDPLYDPIGAIDGILGYFTKHFLYPAKMGRDPFSSTEPYTWEGRSVSCDDGVCLVSAKSAFAELVQGWATDIGYTGEIGDFLAKRPTIGLPLGIQLSNLQPIVRLVQGFAPPLPQLGYGAYLPDLFVFEDILQGIITLSPARFVRGVTALAQSVRSIILAPVNFVRHWAGAIVGPVVTPQQATLTSTADDDTPAPAELRAFGKTLALIEDVDDAADEDASDDSAPTSEDPDTKSGDGSDGKAVLASAAAPSAESESNESPAESTPAPETGAPVVTTPSNPGPTSDPENEDEDENGSSPAAGDQGSGGGAPNSGGTSNGGGNGSGQSDGGETGGGTGTTGGGASGGDDNTGADNTGGDTGSGDKNSGEKSTSGATSGRDRDSGASSGSGSDADSE
ncbi:cutinase family protein [Gordonia paraffinivorans]|uniref:cutinase family protein n=1 Tax=Gordonia paraffinivorans TaxID=175628 RepID=UPI003FCD60A8